jgi:hypothetical protein
MSAAPLQFLLITFAGWVNQRQLAMIDYLKAENLVLRQQLGGRKPRFTDDQRRRLAVKGRVLGHRVLEELAGLVTPETILRWYRVSSSPPSTTAPLAAELVVPVRRRPFGISSFGWPRRTRPGATHGFVMFWATLGTSSPATRSSASSASTVSNPRPRAAVGCPGAPS